MTVRTTSVVRRALARTLPALLALTLLAGCGSAGPDAANPDGVEATTAGSVTRAVVASDVDGDGRSDLLTVPLTDDEDPACWRARPDGVMERREDWHDHPAVESVRRDLMARPEHEILGDHGIRDRVRGNAADRTYAVLHLERPERDAPLGEPTIHGLEPTSGPTGTLVAIRGHDLAERDERTAVTFDGLDARVLVAFRRFVLAIAPDTLPLGAVDVVVSRGESASEPAGFEVVEHGAPLVTAVAPEPVSPGILAVVDGMHLGTLLDEVEVDFGGVQAEHVLPLGRRLIVRVPAGATSGPLTVTVNGVAGIPFAIDVAANQPAPNLTAVVPAQASTGSLVDIQGEHLFVIGRRIRVTFGTVRATVFARSARGLLAVVPTGADGDIRVEVGGQASDSLPFELLDRGLPRIDRIEPGSGAPLDSVDIEGTDLYDLSFLRPDGPTSMRLLMEFTVSFGDIRAFLVLPTAAGLRVVVPMRAETGDVVVTVNAKRSNAVPFTVTR